MIRDLVFVYPDFLIIAADWFSIVSPKDYFEAAVDDHAGESETSVMMHYHPELVNLAEAGDGESHPFAIPSLNEKVGWAPRHWDKADRQQGRNPKKASAEKGERYEAGGGEVGGNSLRKSVREVCIDILGFRLYIKIGNNRCGYCLVFKCTLKTNLFTLTKTNLSISRVQN